jgi:hypothetical protein
MGAAVEVDPVRAAVWVRLPRSDFRTPSEVLKPILKKRELLLTANRCWNRNFFKKGLTYHNVAIIHKFQS